MPREPDDSDSARNSRQADEQDRLVRAANYPDRKGWLFRKAAPVRAVASAVRAPWCSSANASWRGGRRSCPRPANSVPGLMWPVVHVYQEGHEPWPSRGRFRRRSRTPHRVAWWAGFSIRVAAVPAAGGNCPSAPAPAPPPTCAALGGLRGAAWRLSDRKRRGQLITQTSDPAETCALSTNAPDPPFFLFFFFAPGATIFWADAHPDVACVRPPLSLVTHSLLQRCFAVRKANPVVAASLRVIKNIFPGGGAWSPALPPFAAL